MSAPQEIWERYQAALEALLEKVKQDRAILAAILFGSLSYDEVWEKSDIDLWLISRDGGNRVRHYCLVEDGIDIHTQVIPRNQFKRSLERALQGSFLHSTFARSTLLFSHDDSIEGWYRDAQRVGTRDREIQVMAAAAGVLHPLTKAEKWFHVKRDLEYSFLWIMYAVNSLAQMEVVLNGEVAGREVIHQAMRHQPELFRALYTDLIHQPKSEAAIRAALDRINGYLDGRAARLFRPVLDFLAEARGVRTTTELDAHFQKRTRVEGLAGAYEWLASRGLIQKVAAPLRLTEKSRVEVEEAAYHYDEAEGVEFV